jgi:undecaprenyl-diphosphatase
MSLIEALILGLVQGLTEFLPVSSSGHIELVKVIFDQQVKEGLFFTLVLHAATALSTIVIFRKEILGLFTGIVKKGEQSSWNYILLIIISMIPAALVGFFLEDKIETLFNGNLLLVGTCLLITGIVLFFSDKIKNNENELSPKNALWVGVIQAIAILPGISRSGSTIAGGVLLGIDRAKMAAFSFIMVLPLIVGASFKKVMDFGTDGIAAELPDLSALLVAFLAAFVAGLFACKWMISLVKQSKLSWFAYYCWLVGTISIVSYFVV